MQGNSPDEEHIDIHGECNAEIKRLQAEIDNLRQKTFPPTLAEPVMNRRPPWQRIIDLFLQHKLPEPPWRLRDELVYHLVNSEKFAASEKCAEEAEALASRRLAGNTELLLWKQQAERERDSSQASLLRVVGERDLMARVLMTCAHKFRSYEHHHSEKGDGLKAAANREMAALCDTALSPYTEKEKKQP